MQLGIDGTNSSMHIEVTLFAPPETVTRNLLKITRIHLFQLSDL